MDEQPLDRDDHASKTALREYTTRCAWCMDEFTHRLGKDIGANLERKSKLETERDAARRELAELGAEFKRMEDAWRAEVDRVRYGNG